METANSQTRVARATNVSRHFRSLHLIPVCPQMEAVGLAVGVVGLLGTFTACVECFDLILMGWNIGEDYQTCMIKLDTVRLRFNRWGQTVGLSQDSDTIAEERLKSALTSPEEDIATVERLLGGILMLFESAAKLSKIHGSSKQQTKDMEETKEDHTLNALHEKMRGLAIRRQKLSSLKQKTAWALYRKKQFIELIANLTEMISALVDLVPAAPQQQLCKSELEEISDSQDLVILDDILQESLDDDNQTLDTHLAKEVTKIIDERKGTATTTAWKRSNAGDGSRIRQGDDIASGHKAQVSSERANYVVEDSKFGKNVQFHQGNRYG